MSTPKQSREPSLRAAAPRNLPAPLSQTTVGPPSTATNVQTSSAPIGEGQNSSINELHNYGSGHDSLDIDSVISRLLEVSGFGLGEGAQLLEAEIGWLCTKAQETFLSQPVLLEIEAPIKILGGIRGYYFDLPRWFEQSGFPPDTNYLFLGNYVDCNNQSLETICLCLAYKIKYPESVFMLRGLRECAAVNRVHGFYDVCKRRYSKYLWKHFTDMTNCMPMVAIVDRKIMCVSGGPSRDLESMDQIRQIRRPTDIPDQGLLYDLLWSEPDLSISGWSAKDQHDVGFGPDALDTFCNKHDLDLIVRSKEYQVDGYEYFGKRRLVSLWSAPGYKEDYPNPGALLSVDANLKTSIELLSSDPSKQNPYGRVEKLPDDDEPSLKSELNLAPPSLS